MISRSVVRAKSTADQLRRFFDLVSSRYGFCRIQDASTGNWLNISSPTPTTRGNFGRRPESAEHRQFLGVIGMGTMHIFTGVDHMSFLLGLFDLSAVRT